MPQQSLKQRILGFFADNDVKVTAPEPTTSKNRKSAEYLAAERALIDAESQYGRLLFGNIKPGHTREFFCLEKNVWIWYEDGRMIRYEVRQDGVYKKVDSGPYVKISGAELWNFQNAVKTYSQIVKKNVYQK